MATFWEIAAPLSKPYVSIVFCLFVKLVKPPVIHYCPFQGGGSDVVLCCLFWCQSFGDVLPYVCSLYFEFDNFGFKSGIWLLIAPVPVHCFSITFLHIRTG